MFTTNQELPVQVGARCASLFKSDSEPMAPCNNADLQPFVGHLRFVLFLLVSLTGRIICILGLSEQSRE